MYIHTYLTTALCYDISLVLPWKSNDEEAPFYKGLGWEFSHSGVLLKITFCQADTCMCLKLPWALPFDFVGLMMAASMCKNRKEFMQEDIIGVCLGKYHCSHQIPELT